MWGRFVAAVFLTASLAGCLGSRVSQPLSSAAQAAPQKTGKYSASRPFLNMPEDATGPIPALLSQTGAFADVKRMEPAATLLPYALALSFWSDGAVKTRYAAIPDAAAGVGHNEGQNKDMGGKVAFSAEGDWKFPPGTVFVKTFELPTDATQPAVKRRLETRLLIIDRSGGVYGVSYRWRADLSDADLVVPEGKHEDVQVRDAAGTHVQSWYYPSRKDCLECHNGNTSGTLGPKTRQLNSDFRYPDGTTENQLRRWNRLGLFDTRLTDTDIAAFPTLARSDDTSRSLEDRARSYLDANCSQCHRPGGTVANFDARYPTPLAEQNLIDGPVLIDQNIDRARVVSPHDPWRSVLLLRVNTNTDIRMPPLARNTIDTQGAALLKSWIESLPGRDVLAPPQISPAGGSFDKAVSVTIASGTPDAEIRYTVDGSVPGPKDPLYQGPIRIEGPATVRARAYKQGLTRSVIAQQTYVVSP